ncbi:MAG: hypothetical protein Ct9H300mP1_24840 [Planctomycetaceae bacterium]|nr:MAG: hypothetical protein Ct9H300mP1_24840 [Planctomycetaceae bacterium]
MLLASNNRDAATDAPQAGVEIDNIGARGLSGLSTSGFHSKRRHSHGMRKTGRSPSVSCTSWSIRTKMSTNRSKRTTVSFWLAEMSFQSTRPAFPPMSHLVHRAP